MKLIAILTFNILLSSMALSGTLKNVLIGPGVFPTEPSNFIKCVVEKSLAGSNLKFVGLVAVNLLPTSKSRIGVQFLAKDDNGKTGFFRIYADSTYEQNGWQNIKASDGNTFYFSQLVNSTALVLREGSDTAAVFDFLDCQNVN